MNGAVEGADVTDPLRHPPFNAYPRPRSIISLFEGKGEIGWNIYKADKSDAQMPESEWKCARRYKPSDATNVVEIAHPHENAIHVIFCRAR